MLRVGLTGGTGAGKSTVAAHLASRGARVIDADALAREVLAPGTPGLAQVVARFGPGVLDGDVLDRAALAGVVFADAAARADLETITHPLIAARTAELMAAAPAGSVVVHDIPLLVEKAMGDRYHLVVVVTAPEEVRVERLVTSRPITADQARARIAAQADDAARRAVADILIDTDRPGAEVRAELDSLWDEQLLPLAAQLAAEPGTDPVTDPEAGTSG